MSNTHEHISGVCHNDPPSTSTSTETKEGLE